MIGGPGLVAALASVALTKAAELEGRIPQLRQRAAELLVQAGTIEIRRASGEKEESLALPEQALRTSLANVGLEERNELAAAARDVAFRALIAVVSAVA